MMRRITALVVGIALMVGVAVPAAHAGAATNVALGLASFAVFNQVVGGGLFHPRHAYARPVVVERPVVYTQPVVYSQPAAYPTVVQYPNGRYELHGDGVYTAYQWVWIASAPLPPPPPPAPPSQ
jgi:hypothetical protein